MTQPDYTFLTGAPGSRWSAVSQIITGNYNYNTEDETSWRKYTHGDFTGHRGSYFGPGMELGQKFHMLESTYGNDVESFLHDCDRAWDGAGTGTKMVKCHQFAYSLGWLRRKNIPNSNILLVRRGNQECFDWWKEAGGWDITYPNYTWYGDDDHMRHYIEAENKLATEFVSRRSEWEPFTERWLTHTFGPHNIKLSESFNDVQVALVQSK